MTKTEEYNLKEEIKDEISKAVSSGINNEICSVFKIMRKDHFSPKGKAIILNNDIYDKILYKCNLCNSCNETLCNTFQKARQVLVLRGKEMNINKEMVNNLKNSGNVYGIIE